jgi:predicted ATPase/transcriptional regulator with XRE-family HTH domain
MDAEPSFGQWLKKRRKALDLTQKELAQRVPCAVITLQKLEAGRRRPSKQMAERLAEHLGVTPEERPAFVRFARTEPGAHWPASLSPVAQLASWSPWPRRLTNLPLPPTPLIGRDQEVATARERLLGDANRLLTLVGPPGVGKTRLAIQAGNSLLDDFGDGVYFVELAPVGDPNLVAATIAQTLGLNETADRPFAAGLKEYLRDKHMLLVLDNFEQVASAAPFVSELLAKCPWLSVLVTSRAPLRVRRERQFPVPPLAVPTEADAGFDLAEWIHYPAIALFVERSRAVRPGFALIPENAGAVAAICARVDGLPLAIELVAARMGALLPQALLERLSTQLMLHTAELRDLSDRHRTLHNAIDWSYALLGPEEQSLLARLGVFLGGWTLGAAESVAFTIVDHSSLTALDALTSLVNSNLVVLQKHDGESRYTLLETIRAYALERLAERGEEEAVRQRHAEYYLALAEEAGWHLRTAEQQVWLDRLEAERSNMRAALSWFIECTADIQAGLRLAGVLGHFWNIRGYVDEGHHWSSRALQRGRHASPALRARVLFWAGMFAWPGDLPVARSLVEESLALLRELGPSQHWELAFALTGFALIMAYQADCDAVQAAAEEALALFQQMQDKWGVALSLACLGEAHLLRHDYNGACSRFEESLALFRESGDKWGIGIPLLNWGYTDSLQGNLDAARARLEESVTMHREVGERAMRSLTLNILGQVVQQQGDYQQAAALYAESLDLLRKMGLEASSADVLHNLAYLAQSQGHYPLAAKPYRESLTLFSRQGNEEGIAKCRVGLAAVSSVPEDVESAA